MNKQMNKQNPKTKTNRRNQRLFPVDVYSIKDNGKVLF